MFVGRTCQIVCFSRGGSIYYPNVVLEKKKTFIISFGNTACTQRVGPCQAVRYLFKVTTNILFIFLSQ